MPLHRRYYALAAGTWVGTYTFRITRPLGLLTADLPWFDKATLIALAAAEWVLGPASLRTVVHPTADPDLVEHDAILSRWGLTLYRARRRLQLDPDGVSLQVTGHEQTWPFLGPPRALAPGHGTTRDPQHTDYVMAMAGASWEVRFVIGPRHAWSDVTTPWAHGQERLVRQRPHETPRPSP